MKTITIRRFDDQLAELLKESVDEETAEKYSAILQQLKRQGTPIPTN